MASALVLGCSSSTSVAPGTEGPPPTGEMATMAHAVLDEVNRVRTNPQGYANELEALLPYYDGTVLRRPGEAPHQTVEGRAAVEEAIRVLRAQSPLPALTWSDPMAHAAYDHVVDLGPKGMTGHIGSDGSTPSDRLRRYGSWVGYVSENVAFGQRTAAVMVQDFVIDDGVPDRGHRQNILYRSIRVAGAACGAHATYRTICVVDHAAGYIPR